MNRCRPSRLVHPLRGCGDTRGNALYRDASPNGDKGCNNQHLGARHVSATTPPRWEDYGHTVFTAPPPQCADATTTLHSPFSILNSSFSHTFSAKERDSETGLSYFGARYYSSDLSIWLSVDPMSDKYPSLSPYVYCADNPIKLVDPNGEDPIYAKNFWGNVKKIGDNGQCESNSYLVLGDKVKEVKAATKSGKFYTGDLSPSDMVIHIPTGQIQQDIQLTVDQSLKSGNSPENRVEYGGHSLFGDKTARFWDPGTPTQTTTYNGVTIQKRTIEPFKIGGKGALIGGPPEKVQYIWHVHTCSSVPSSLDYEKMDSWRKAGFKGCAIVVCPNDSGVSFYNERGTLVRIHYEDFKKMGRQEDIQ